MKTLIKEYLHIIAIGILGMLFGLSFYYILINTFHSASINKKVYVSNNDIYYKNYQNNLNSIKNNLDNYKYIKNKYIYDKNKIDLIYSSINTCYNKLNSKDGFYKTKKGYTMLILDGVTSINDIIIVIGYVEVNRLNDYFINELINECYIVSLNNVINNNNNSSKLKNISVNSKTIADIYDWSGTNSATMEKQTVLQTTKFSETDYTPKVLMTQEVFPFGK